MAVETGSSLHAAVKVDPSGTIISRTGIASVVRNGAGNYTVNLTNGVGTNGEVRSDCLEGTVPGVLTVTRTTPTAYNVRTFDSPDTPADRRWNLSVYALTNRS